MARTTSQIHEELMAEKANRPELAGIDTISRTSIFSGLLWLVAFGVNMLEQFFDLFKNEVDTKLSQREPGTPAWYAAMVLEFQDGDPLIIKDGAITYNTIDPAKRIISRSAYKENEGALTLKVAKGEVGSESALSADELVRLGNFMERRKYAGTKVNLISLNADKLRVEGTIYYDGIYTAANVKAGVEAALRNYMKTLAFDGIVRRIKLVDAVQGVEGVTDLNLTITAIAGATPTVVSVNYETASGYLAEDDAIPFANLTYQAV